MGGFLANMIRVLEFVVKETPSREILRILAERIRHMFESSVVERDIDNFIAYFRVLISAQRSSKQLEFNRKLVRAFIERTDTSLGNSLAGFRTERLHTYLSAKIKDGAQITEGHLKRIHEEFEIMKMPSLEKVMENMRVAMILKWVQGQVMKQFSDALQDYIVVFATVYGECRKHVMAKVEWPTLRLTRRDKDFLHTESRKFKSALSDALDAFKDAQAKNPDPNNYEEQFQIVFNSLDRLAEMEAAHTLDTFDSFKYRIIVSSSLIYIQDDYVIKDDKLRQLIQLFVSMYIKYRDKRHAPASQ
jgi:hypothetical protein